VTLQWAGLVLAVLTFGTIGLGHVAVRKLNYRYGTKPPPFFFVLGLGLLGLSLLVTGEFCVWCVWNDVSIQNLGLKRSSAPGQSPPNAAFCHTST
jgi:hypothetical protein